MALSSRPESEAVGLRAVVAYRGLEQPEDHLSCKGGPKAGG